MIDDKIKDFISTKPEVIDIIGYGSGVKEQAGYTNETKRQIDIIATVDDLEEFHKNNFIQNKEEYSKLGFYFLKYFNHIGTDINYISNIKYKDDTFKMGIIEKNDLIRDLNNWENLYMAGRCQKPIKIIKSSNSINNAILINRMNALKTALILNYDKTITEKSLYESICSLSYIGDIRMRFKCENPNKIKNIVEGSYKEYKTMYTEVNNNLYDTSNGKVIINTDKILNEINFMPKCLVDFLIKQNKTLDGISKDDLEELKYQVYTYLKMTNLKSSTCQPIKSIVLNGTNKSLNYLGEKIKKGRM